MTSQADLIADLKTLGQIAQTLNQAVDVQGALNESLATLVDLMSLDTGWIFLKDELAIEPWWGKGYVLAAHYNLPPAMNLENPDAWKVGCDCQGFCNKGKLTEAYNEVRCSRLGDVEGEKRDLLVHASAPLRSGKRVLGILNVAAPAWDDFSPRSLALLENAGAQMGIALERAYLFDMLQERRIHEQAALLDLSNQLLSRTDLNDLMDYIVGQVHSLLQVDAVALLLPGANPNQLDFLAATGWKRDPVAKGRQVPAGQGSRSGQVMESKRPLVMNSFEPNNALPDLSVDWFSPEGFKSAVLIPLVAQEKSFGVMAIHSRTQRRFDDEEVRFLQLMANQAAMAIERARLRKEEIARQRLEKELAVGRQIQLSLLPKASPAKPGWEFCDIYKAARQVGGDLYDFFELPGQPNLLGLVIGDVADKGVPAALFMGVSRTLIRSAALSGASPAKALEEVNRLILAESKTGLFLSAFYGILDTSTGRFTFSNAGHDPPLIYRSNSGDFLSLSTNGIVLGILDQLVYKEDEVTLSPADLLICYTDGVTEAMNPEMEEFGLDRLQEVITTCAGGSATDVLESIVTAVDNHAGQMDQFDDFTLFVVKRLGTL
ncbi:MAG: SpoIIE family protein phosphatase [Chloroflexota bacterium]|jgi:sigma-B regulation protein RsbU (phosphoserine phosphatase)